MDWNKKIPQWMLLLALPVILLACTVSYKFNGASINYDKVKTIDQRKALTYFLEYLFLIQDDNLSEKFREIKDSTGGVIKMSIDEIREKYLELLKDKEYLEKVYAMGAAKAEKQARKTLRKVYKKVGLIERKFL